MQLNFEKQNLKSCTGYLGFIRKGPKCRIFFMQFIAILWLCYNLMQFCNYSSNFYQKKRFWANILCN